MRYQRTQISLEPEHHQKLVDEAAERGISLAELMRQLVGKHVGERAAPYETKSWDAIVGVAPAGEPMDVARDFDELIGEAMEANYERKMGRDPGPPQPRGRKRAPR